MAKFATTFALGMIAQVAQAEKCYVLALSSGEESAAYQAGVIKGLAETLDMHNRSYDAISGVQGGAVSAVLLSAFEKGDEVAAAQRLQTFWQNAANSTLCGLYSYLELKSYEQQQTGGLLGASENITCFYRNHETSDRSRH